MARKDEIEFSRASNLQANLRRIFDTWGNQSQVARDANMQRVHLNRIINGMEKNPTLNTVEAIAGALEIPFETLLRSNASDLELKIKATADLQRA